MDRNLRVLFIGDIIGQPGKFIVSRTVEKLRSSLPADLVIANGENLAGGKGITPNLASKVFSTGVDLLTSGNHIWKNPEVFRFIDTEPRLLRPLNFPPHVPGRGWTVIRKEGLPPVCVMNLMGRANLLDIDCPFRAADSVLSLSELSEIRIRIVDFHAETSSEKIAMGWYLDGRVSAVIGTHTHVQTADETILPGGTAYISDTGMTGPHDSVLGIEKETVIRHFLTRLPYSFKIASHDLKLKGVLVEINPATGGAVSITRIVQEVPEDVASEDNGTA